VAQPGTIRCDLATNVTEHATAVLAADARVVVFPELSLTGYELDAPVVSPSDHRLAPLIDTCRETGSVALAGAPARGWSGQDHIAMLAVDGAGARVVYEKRWLGGAETERFTPGARPAVIEIDGWRLGLAICKDTGVAQHAADTAALGIDVYLAGVLELEDDCGVQPERARTIARDHSVWVAIASFAGATGGGYDDAAGRSAIWRPDGSVAAAAGRDTGEIARAVLVDPAADTGRRR
jgi:predicted amidohydrolase